jgi:hypothetical protein
MTRKSLARALGTITLCGFLAAAGSSRAQAPYATTQAAGPIAPSSATLNGMATPRGQSTAAWFEWGPDANYGQTTTPVDVGSGGGVVRVSASVGNLHLGGVYHYRLVAANATAVTYGADRQFTTAMRISTWGDFSQGRLPLVGGLTNLVGIGCGHDHGLALRNDGTVAAWMSYLSYVVGQTNVPAGLSNVVAVTGGWCHSLALRQDGTVVAWGRYFDNGNNIEAAFVPSGLSNVIAIAGGDEHSVALKSDGTVIAWGVNTHGELNVPRGLSNVVAITAGSTHTLALKDDGTVVAWGSSVGGDMTPPAWLTNVVAIVSEVWHNLALRADGTVVAWGENQYGDTAVPPQATDIAAIATGFRYSLALGRNGVLVAWGDPAYCTNLPSALVNAVAIAGGDLQSLALAAVNLPPTAFPAQGTGAENTDIVVSLSGWDPNGDTLHFRPISLPANGSLYQFAGGARGALISDINTVFTDPLNRFIFTPAPNTYGVPYASFSCVADDSQFLSAPVSVTVNVIATPVLHVADLVWGPNPSLLLNFTGSSNVTYEVLASSDLINWVSLGDAAQSSPGQFYYQDYLIAQWPRRFYSVQSR